MTPAAYWHGFNQPQQSVRCFCDQLYLSLFADWCRALVEWQVAARFMRDEPEVGQEISAKHNSSAAHALCMCLSLHLHYSGRVWHVDTAYCRVPSNRATVAPVVSHGRPTVFSVFVYSTRTPHHAHPRLSNRFTANHCFFIRILAAGLV